MEHLRDHLLQYPDVTEETPFGPDVVVYKIRGKMIGLVAYEEVPPTMNLKCDPDWALQLRDAYDAVRPGYHMSKKHWNTVVLDFSLEDTFIREMIDHSVSCVVKKMPKKDRAGLEVLIKEIPE